MTTSHPARFLIYPLIVGIVLIGGAGIAYGLYDAKYQGEIFPGVKILDLDLGGKTPEEATRLLANRLSASKISPVTVTYETFSSVFEPVKYGFKVDAGHIAQNAYAFGRRGSLSQRIQERLQSLNGKVSLAALKADTIYEFDEKALMATLNEYADKINRPPENPKLTIKGDRATEFIPGHNGVELNKTETVPLLIQAIFSGNDHMTLPTKEAPADKQLAETNKLGINTRIAQGVSDFSGSPVNRRHNIGVGAKRFDGLIVAPGETFSFVRNLGPVDDSTGYRPELVIKGDKTEPEFGGGLCQVSTTAFRAILNGGLPVMERHNHSYRVVYYEPAGTDATIYEPYPDLKFTNDTPGSILMDTYIEGNKLYFDFYGTDIGRTVELDGPHIFNVTDFPEPIYIDTSTLPVGVTKKVDTAHRGADAVLNRKIFMHGKLVKTDTFKSHYIPWAAKYLRGVPEAAPVQTDPNNITPPTTNTEPSPTPSTV